MKALLIVNLIIAAFVVICYGYQFFYIFAAYFGKDKPLPPPKKNRLAILICARNEERVIGRLIESLKAQSYDRSLYEIFVGADNCTDDTASVARGAGAVVYERENKTEIGKGYVLDFLLSKIWRDYGEDCFDGFVVFDADNIADRNFLTEINKVFSGGYDVVSSYRNASNYGKNWLSAGSAMYFLRDSVIMNRARAKLGCNTCITGTGFLFSNNLAKRNGGWPFHTLTEDGEFTLDNACNHVSTSSAYNAIFYDEQPETLADSWNQRVRWCKGGLQIFKLYFARLVRGIFGSRFLSFFDMANFMFCAYITVVLSIIANIIAVPLSLAFGTDPLQILAMFGIMTALLYLALVAFSLPITVSEWKRIHAPSWKKILYIFTFPLFIFSFAPPAVAAILKPKVEWKQHSRNKASGEKAKEKASEK